MKRLPRLPITELERQEEDRRALEMKLLKEKSEKESMHKKWEEAVQTAKKTENSADIEETKVCSV